MASHKAEGLKAQAESLANRTADAYSYDTYGETAWRTLIRYLLDNYGEDETEAIIRSKHTRWAADDRKGRKATSADFIRYWSKHYPHGSAAATREIRELMVGTYGYARKALEIPGWEDISTGGGCNALAKQMPNGLYWLMTDGDSQCPAEMNEYCTLELLDEGAPADGEHFRECATVTEALAIVAAYVVPATDAAKVQWLEAKRQVEAKRYPTYGPDGKLQWVSIPEDK